MHAAPAALPSQLRRRARSKTESKYWLTAARTGTNQETPRNGGGWRVSLFHCGLQGIETVIVVFEPFPPHAQKEAALRTSGQAFKVDGRVIPAGAGIRLALDPAKTRSGDKSAFTDIEFCELYLAEGIAHKNRPTLRSDMG